MFHSQVFCANWGARRRIASNGGVHCVTVLFIRNGAVVGSRDHFPKLPGETDKGKLLNGFVSQYYLGRDAPAEIVLDVEIEDAPVLEQELTSRWAGRSRWSTLLPGACLRECA